MCDAIRFEYQSEILTSSFKYPRATLPVLLKDGSLQFLPWGRRQGQPGQLPFGGWAKLDMIHGGHWDRFFPVPVKIPCTYYMLKDYEGREKWYLNAMKAKIQGLVAKIDNERRIYIVITEPDIHEVDFHEHSPRMV